MVKLYVELAVRLGDSWLRTFISYNSIIYSRRTAMFNLNKAWTVRNPIQAEAYEKLDEIIDESMYVSPHQLQETSSTYLAWQKHTKDDFEGFLTCRAREFKQKGMLALVLSSRPKCLEGIVFLKVETENRFWTLINTKKRFMGLFERNKNNII